jgi:hypothetical protein
MCSVVANAEPPTNIPGLFALKDIRPSALAPFRATKDNQRADGAECEK